MEDTIIIISNTFRDFQKNFKSDTFEKYKSSEPTSTSKLKWGFQSITTIEQGCVLLFIVSRMCSKYKILKLGKCQDM